MPVAYNLHVGINPIREKIMATKINQFTRPFTAGSMPTFARLVRGCLILLALISPVAQASDVTGKITKVETIDADVFFVSFETSTLAGTPPACAINTVALKRYAVKTSTASGKAIIASLLVAFQASKTVTLVGRGGAVCDVWFDTESTWVASVRAN